MQEKEVRDLFNKYLSGQCSSEEKDLLESWYLNYEADDLVPLSESQYKLIKESSLRSMPDFSSLKAEEENIKAFRSKNKKPIFNPFWIAAAVACIILAIGLYFYRFSTEYPEQGTASLELEDNDVLAGGNRAYLTVGDGTVVDLSRDYGGIIMDSGGITYEDGTVLHDLTAELRRDLAVEPVSFVLRTPKGGKYQITLPDGTKVWLNADSKLTYPNIFQGDTREVHLEGEAYFDVVENSKQPFVVVSGNQLLRVLGTQFSIQNYSDNNNIFSTLVRGSVAVSLVGENNKSSTLKPNQQSVLSKSQNTFEISNVDTHLYTGWKDGLFVFKNTPLPELLSQLARWYDIAYSYDADLRGEVFNGEIESSSSLQRVLRLLELSGLKFSIETQAGQKTIIVRK